LTRELSLKLSCGRFEQAKSDAQQAMPLSPRDPEMPNRLINLGMAEVGLGHFDAAVVEFQKAIRLRRSLFHTLR
jgi:Flp pilus assembly protein TadD